MFPIYIRPVHARHADMKAEILLVNMIHFRSNSYNKHCPDNECSEIRVRATPLYSIFALSALHIVQLYGEHAPSQPTLPTKKKGSFVEMRSKKNSGTSNAYTQDVEYQNLRRRE